MMPSASHTHEPAVSRSSGDDAVEREIIVFDRQAVRAVDRAAIEEYGIPGILLMENAARGLLAHALKMLAPQSRVLIVCGSGNNGGDGYALARHLHNHDVSLLIASLGEPKPQSDAGINRTICDKMSLRQRAFEEVARETNGREFDLIVDAIFGTGLDRPPAGAAAEAIDWINRAQRPVLAVDVPSGMDCDTGRPLGLCVKATATVTFVGMKAGFLDFEAQKLLGDVVVADIGAPRELIERFGRRIHLPRRPESPEHHRMQ